MRTEFGELHVTYTGRGLPRYEIQVIHKGLSRYQVVKGDNQYNVQQKAAFLASKWDMTWASVSKRNHLQAHHLNNSEEAGLRTSDAETLQKELTEIFSSLSVTTAVDWESLKDNTPFSIPRPTKPVPPPSPEMKELFSEPDPDAYAFRPHLTFIDRLFQKRSDRKVAEAAILFEKIHSEWLVAKAATESQHVKAIKNHQAALRLSESHFESQIAEWEATAIEYSKNQALANKQIDEKRSCYLAKEPEAVNDVCDMVLNNSTYPDSFPRTWDLDYVSDSRLLVVDYQLPAPDDLPTLVAVKYIKTRDAFDEKHLSEAERNRIYDNVLYQITLRTLHELFWADVANALDSIAFNGIVDSVDRSTGHHVRACILTIQVNRDEFDGINFSAVDPKTCFKKLKGVGSSKLHGLSPVAPLVQMNRDDARFVAGYAVADGLTEGHNLAAMDWEDFEHLIRELFEREFQKNGAEVRVTRASRDGGIDAVIFDPDPIRGGKIVVQAKRYTNTVSVSAVRDLFGSVMAEGANKGILVTTADYGPDAYAFAKGKPLTLLSGSNLLHLLQVHGVKARIDLAEARLLLGLTV